jgi:hypothetical protein
MENNKLIAGALLEIARRSETTFLEVGKEDKELIDAAKKLGIELPSPDLMVMKTIYAEIDKVNLNGVILPKKAVKEGLNTLIGKQCNWEHDGAGFVCGYTISAKINEDKIETINVLFKSLFIDQAEELKEKVKSGEAAVSFEIWNKDPETGKSVVKELENGFKEISPIIFHGTGVLLTHKPACPKAKIFKLVAHNLVDVANDIMHRVFEKDLIYAQLAIENNEKEEKIMVKCEKCGKDFEASAEEKICVECASLPKEEPKTQLPEETKIAEKPIETQAQVVPPVAAETKIEELKVEVTPEVKAQELETIVPKIVAKVTRIYSDLFVDTYSADGTMSGTSEGKSSFKKITEYTDGTKDEVIGESEYKNKYDLAELEEKVNAAKAEKDAEIVTLKTEHERILAEKDIEIQNKTQELGQKDQEITDLKNPKVEEKKEKTMAVGAVITDSKSEVKKQADEINKIIANKGK